MSERRTKVVGIDVGSSKVSVCVLEGDRSWESQLELPPAKSGEWMTQRPVDWLRATDHLLGEAHAGVGLEDVEALGITATTPTFVFVDKSGRPVGENAIMWFDTSRMGRPNGAGTNVGLRKLAAVQCRSPSLIQEAWRIMDAGDFIRFQQTSRLAMSKAVLAQKLAWSPENGFDLDGLQDFETDRITTRLPLRVVETGEVVGPLRSKAMKRRGLKQGIPVVACGYDTTSAMIGGGIYEPSDSILLSGGTSLGLYVIPTIQNGDLGPWPFQKYMVPGSWKTIAGGCEAGVQSFGILHKKLLLTCRAASRSLRIEAELIDAEQRYPSSTFSLPFGNVPIRAPFHRVLPTLISTADTLLPRSVGSLVAMRRGVAYFVRYCIEDLRSRGVQIGRINMVGGVTRSPSFCQLIASVCRLRVYLFGAAAAAKGAAILAAVAQSGVPSAEGFVLGSRRNQKVFEPDCSRLSFYDDGYRVFTSHLRCAMQTTEEQAVCLT